MPGGEHGDHRRERRGGKGSQLRGPGLSPQVADQDHHEPQPGRQCGQTALGGDLERHVVEVRRALRDRGRVAIVRVDLDHHVRPDPGERVVFDDVEAGADHRQSIRVGRVGEAEGRVEAVRQLHWREDHEHRGDHRDQGDQAEVTQHEEQTDAGTGTDPRIAAERQCECDQDRRHDQRGPQPILRLEHDPRRRDAGDQHDQPRVGHVVAKRALDPLPEIVEIEDPVLDDAVDGAERTGADHHVHRFQRSFAAQQPVGDRHDRVEHQLLRIDEADLTVDRER